MRVACLPMLGLVGLVGMVGCADKELDASDPSEQGEACDPAANADDAEEGQEGRCAEGLACEPVGTTEDYVCGAPLEIRGTVYDATTGLALEGAHVSALDETGAPVSDVAVTDAEGRYALAVSARRDPDGRIAEALKWTLFSSAADYQPFPAGVRPAIPVNAVDAVSTEEAVDDQEGDDETIVLDVIDNASTEIALIPLGAAEAGGSIVSGTVAGELAAGTMVVAEGGTGRTPYTIADKSGHYTLFNVQPGAVSVRGYRQGAEVEPVALTVSEPEHIDVDLALVTEDVAALGSVAGSVNIVNAPGGSTTSVVLVPVSCYNDALERGPVPFGLRAPGLPEAPTVTGAFSILGVPSGTYKVLAAFENDFLVRDPDASIGGTTLQEITIDAGEAISVDESFKITEGLTVFGPGADAPEAVSSAPVLTWADDSSEDFYTVEVFDALGNLVWEDDAVPGVSGSDRVEVTYGGPLDPGMYYQFRATSWKESSQGTFAISRTEDLRGVFVFGSPEPTDGDEPN